MHSILLLTSFVNDTTQSYLCQPLTDTLTFKIFSLLEITWLYHLSYTACIPNSCISDS